MPLPELAEEVADELSAPPPPIGLVGIILPPTPLVRAKSPKDILGSVAYIVGVDS